jgi:uncharacterized protein (UPF0218 family)
VPAAGTRSASSDDGADRLVPESLRPLLAERHGPVFSGPEAEARIRSLGSFAACGDRVTSDALKLGKIPLLAIVDYKTQRAEAIDPSTFAPLAGRPRRRVVNPPGVLTAALRRTVRELLAEGGGLIEVEGEEDLGSLALVESLPAGATVIYGIPGAGVSFVTVDARSKESVRAIIAKMEPRSRSTGR